MIPLTPEFKEFFQALNHSKVEYLLVDGYAVAFYGYPNGAANIGHPVLVSTMTACCPPRFGRPCHGLGLPNPPRNLHTHERLRRGLPVDHPACLG